ncbi:AAEL001224-PA [Aedes aegypti]|uniref:Odorant receptor n=2 Tax=Aedes aegypti TaxID=7159 RepID=Q17LV6_AEDAE|nr:AAEL001224-PA [Aedes aegypti]DAA80407.1 TPA_exp: odorant receptor 70 [Aedes aegypti]
MSAIELYRQCIDILRLLSHPVGVSLWNPDQFLTFGSYSIVTQMVIYFWCNFWTVFKYRHDIIHVMEVLNCAGIAFQLSVKFFIAMNNKFLIRGLLQTIENNLYERYPDRTSSEGEIVFIFARKYNILLKMLAVLYCSTLLVFALYPLYIYYSEGKLIPLFMFEVSYVDWHTVWGYLLTNFVQVVTYLMGLFGMILADGLLVLLVVHGLVYIEVFMIHLRDLAKMLQSENVGENEEKIMELWRECLVEHQTIIEYFTDIETVNGGMCLILVFTGVFAICDNLVLCALTDWYASYLFLLICFVQLTIYFAVGNAVELKSDALDISVVNFPWHLLKIDNQKEYLFLICQMQRPIILTVYGFSNLNLEAYMTILKALYQFAMMILNFLA